MATLPTLNFPTAVLQGFDSFAGHFRANAFATQVTTTSSEGSVTNDVYVCTDSESVSQALSVSGSASANWMSGSASAKASWTQSLNMTSTSVVVIVHTIVQIALTQVNSGDLADTSNYDAASFFEAFGDSYVDSVTTGAEYYAAFIYDCTTTNEQDSISASLKVNQGVVSTSLASSLTDTSSSSNVTMRISQQMTGINNIALPSADATDIVAFSESFSSNDFDAPTIITFTTTGYENAPGATTGTGPQDPNWQTVKNNRSLLGDTTFVTAVSALSYLDTLTAPIQAMYSAYQYTGDTQFNSNYAQIQTDISNLATLIANIEDSVTMAQASLSLPSLGYGTPVVNYTTEPTVSSEPVDITEGSATFFCDLSVPQIAEGVVPASFNLQSSGFRVIYSDGTEVNHGYNTNAGSKSLVIPSSDYITQIGYSPETFEIYQILTAQGLSYGSANGITMTYPPPIIGFAGTVTNVTQMEVIRIRLSPAVWTIISSD